MWQSVSVKITVNKSFFRSKNGTEEIDKGEEGIYLSADLNKITNKINFFWYLSIIEAYKLELIYHCMSREVERGKWIVTIQVIVN